MFHVQMGDLGNEIDEVDDYNTVVPGRSSFVMVSAHMRMYCPSVLPRMCCPGCVSCVWFR